MLLGTSSHSLSTCTRLHSLLYINALVQLPDSDQWTMPAQCVSAQPTKVSNTHVGDQMKPNTNGRQLSSNTEKCLSEHHNSRIITRYCNKSSRSTKYWKHPLKFYNEWLFKIVVVGFRRGVCLVKTFLRSLGNSREGLEPLSDIYCGLCLHWGSTSSLFVTKL